MTEPTLAAVQARFYRLVTAPEDVARVLAGDADAAHEGAELADLADLADLIWGDARLTAIERLDIYARMYFYRLLDVLRTDYPKLLGALGDAQFHNLVTDYLVAQPPAHASVRNAGQRLPGFLAGHPTWCQGRPWLAELAALERARLELFDAADSATLERSSLAALAPEAFASLPLRLVPAHAVLALRRHVGQVWAAVDAGRWDAHEHDLDPSAQDDTPCTFIVWRGRDPMVVHHLVVDAVEAALLPQLVTGIPFALVCERLGEGRGDDEAVRLAARLLSQWLDRGLLASC